MKGSRLKLEGVAAVVVDGIDAIAALDGLEAVEALVGAAPRDAQRIVSGGDDDALDEFVERHGRRAVRFPPRPADARASAASGPAGATTGYLVVTAAGRAEAVAARIAAGDPGQRWRVPVRTPREANVLVTDLRARGFDAATGGSEDARVLVTSAAEPDTGDDDRAVLSASPPFDAGTLRALHGTSGGVVLLEARELPHLRRIAAEAGVPLTAAAGAAHAGGAPDTVHAFRQTVRRALQEEDVDAQLLVLGPLLEEASGAEIAAALAALLRQRRPAVPAPQAQAPQVASAVPSSSSPPPPTAGPAMTGLFISLGDKDRIRPGDLVGAITGEAQVRGEQIGRIEIRETFSLVEVEQSIAERVIGALNGTTLRGRSVRVDYDRKSGGSPGATGQHSPGGARNQPPRGRPPGGRPSGGRPSGGRPSGGRPSGGRPSGGRPSGGRPSGGRPSGGRTGGGGERGNR